MSPRSDSVNQLALDRTAADFAGTPSDVEAQTILIDCLGVEFIDVIVDITTLSGPAKCRNVDNYVDKFDP